METAVFAGRVPPAAEGIRQNIRSGMDADL